MMRCPSCGAPHQEGTKDCVRCGERFPELPPYREGVPVHRVVAVVSAVIAVFGIAWGVFPDLVSWLGGPAQEHATDAGARSRTIGEMRKIVSAVELYKVERGAYPEVTSMEELDGALRPVTVPHTDAWGHELSCFGTTTLFVLGSAGRDGQWERDALADYVTGRTESPDDDLIVRNGRFIRSPES